jgi:para-aminobenzoate synthetase component 1
MVARMPRIERMEPPQTIPAETNAADLGAALAGATRRVIFDDATCSGRWSGAWVAANPDQILSGRWPQECPPVPGEGEFWAGAIGYDGDWVFSRFPGFWHRPSQGEAWNAHGPAPRWEGPPGPAGTIPPPIHWDPGLDREAFIDLVRRAKDYIAAGDIYQVNLAHRFEAGWEIPPDPMALYRQLRAISPAPHAAFLDLGECCLLSASPETFFDRRDARLLTRPIKGTRPRGATPEEDTRLRRELVDSPKERAELVMITDLERNDLGRVCATGSVNVEALCVLESFPQVHHLVSTVAGELRAGADWPAIWQALFPGGSITGAPKKRAIEIIRELEPVPREFYTGAIGWMFGPRRACFNIAIRTAILRGNRLSFHAGSGIVEGSDPGAEFDETHHKASGLARAFGVGAEWNRE